MLAQFAASQPAFACDMHGDMGFGRMNPFLAMRSKHFDDAMPSLDDSQVSINEEEAADITLRAISSNPDTEDTDATEVTEKPDEENGDADKTATENTSAQA
ncbi:MAG: hypothetical protein AAFX04_11690 [Pseudomonadota bacterium]